MSEQVAIHLRQEGLSGTTIRIKLRWPDFTTPTRQHSLAQPTNQDEVIYQVALGLFHSLWKPGMAVRLLGVGVSGLGRGAHQMGLWDTQTEKDRKLLEAVDSLRARFGEKSIQRGRSIRHSDDRD
jgi:DNA polymerase-4